MPSILPKNNNGRLIGACIMASGGANFGDDGVFDVTSNLTVTDSSAWHYLFVSVDRSDNNRCKMYVDGIDRTGAMRGNVSRVADVANALHLRVGTENDGNYSYKGAIAEVNIAFTARSADWVKLSYMNQKERDALVQWQTGGDLRQESSTKRH